MAPRNNKNGQILMLTAGLAGGSFMALKNFADIAAHKFNITIFGLGRVVGSYKGYKVIGIPYPRYDGLFGHITSKYQPLNFFFQIPLFIVAFLKILISPPQIIFFNGLATLIPLLPIVKLRGCYVVLSFRSWWDEGRFGKIKSIIRWYGNLVNLAYVNSDGTKANLSQIIPSERIIVVSHHADKVFFAKQDREEVRTKLGVAGKLVFLFVGRIDEEKHIPLWLNVIQDLSEVKKIQFFFVGKGRMVEKITKLSKKHPTVKYLGFMDKPEELVKLYTAADILLSYADETYLARPAIEALACGTPLIIPSTPAVGEKIAKGVTIPSTLVPKEIGWIVNKEHHRAVSELILNIQTEKTALKMRKTSLEYAKKHYYRDPNAILLEKLLRI